MHKPYRGTLLNRSHPLARGLIGCWLFNENSGNTVFDLSGNGSHGTFIRDTSWQTDIDAAIDFPRQGWPYSYIDIGTVTILNRPNQWTFITRIRCDVSQQSGLFDKTTPNQAGDDGWSFGIWSDNKLWFTADNGVNKFSTGTITIGDITDVGFTADGTNINFYIDGLYNSQASFTGGAVTCPNGARIGGNIIGNELYLDGRMYYVYIYNRALSAPEIQQLYINPYQMFGYGVNPAIFGDLGTAAAGQPTMRRWGAIPNMGTTRPALGGIR